MKILSARPSVLALAFGVGSALVASGCKSSQGSNQTPGPLPVKEAAAPAAVASAPAKDQVLQQKIVAAMSGYEHIVSKEELERMGTPEELTQALIAVHEDPSVHLLVRTNALASLRHFPSPTSKGAMEKALMNPETSDVVRRSAVQAYAAGFGDDAVPILAQMLSHPEVHTRDITAKALGKMGTPEAVAALRRRLPQEQEPMVKKAIESGLSSELKPRERPAR
jgi:hypothetical protein